MQSEAESEGAPGHGHQQQQRPEHNRERKFGRYNRVANYGCRRFQYERLRFIEYTIARHQYPNTPALAAELEVCEMTVKRDIQYLRWSLGHDIGFDFLKNGYFYKSPPGKNSLFAAPKIRRPNGTANGRVCGLSTGVSRKIAFFRVC